jgi:hypothetical protein
MTKTNTLKIPCFCHWSTSISVIVSDFVVSASFTSCRISNFRPKKQRFSVKDYLTVLELHRRAHAYNSNGNGWNQIGCPNPADYAWGDVQVLENGTVIGAISDLPSDNEWIDKRLWCWENGSSDPNNDFMEQGEGYWVRAKMANVSLKFLQINQDPEMEIAQLSNSSIVFAGLFNKAKRWMKE